MQGLRCSSRKGANFAVVGILILLEALVGYSRLLVGVSSFIVVPHQQPVIPDNHDEQHRRDPEMTNMKTAVDMRESTGTLLYSNLRGDRSGSAILDMMYAHAYSYIAGNTYGGACSDGAFPTYTTVPKRYYDTAMLIELLGLSEELKLACPTSNSTTRIMGDKEYRKIGMPEAWLNFMKNKTRQADWFQGAQEGQHKIAVHIRRGDVDPCYKFALGHYSRYLPNSYYMALIEKYRKEGSQVTIFSESKSFESFALFQAKGYNVKLDGNITDV